jgi:hypothetical protein
MPVLSSTCNPRRAEGTALHHQVCGAPTKAPDCVCQAGRESDPATQEPPLESLHLLEPASSSDCGRPRPGDKRARRSSGASVAAAQHVRSLLHECRRRLPGHTGIAAFADRVCAHAPGSRSSPTPPLAPADMSSSGTPRHPTSSMRSSSRAAKGQPAIRPRRTFPDVTGTPAQMSKQESRSTRTRRPLGTRDATVLLGSRLACASDAKQSRWFTAAVGRVDRRPRGGRGARAARPTAVGDALSRTPRGRAAPRASPAAVVGAASRGRGSRFAART